MSDCLDPELVRVSPCQSVHPGVDCVKPVVRVPGHGVWRRGGQPVDDCKDSDIKPLALNILLISLYLPMKRVGSTTESPNRRPRTRMRKCVTSFIVIPNHLSPKLHIQLGTETVNENTDFFQIVCCSHSLRMAAAPWLVAPCSSCRIVSWPTPNVTIRLSRPVSHNLQKHFCCLCLVRNIPSLCQFSFGVAKSRKLRQPQLRP